MPPKEPTKLPVPAAPAGEADEGVAMANVEGRIARSMVTQLRRLVDKNPEAVIGGMRRWLHDD